MIKITKIQIPELPTEKPRRLYVYLPKGYESSGKRYPVLYMFDGHNLFFDSHATYGRSWRMMEYLKKSGLEWIVVGIECNHEDFERLSEYSPWDFHYSKVGSIIGKGEVTMDWIVNTLKPRIDRDYRTLTGREDTMIAGSSMGGLMSVYAVVKYNSVFSMAASLSPTLFLNPAKMTELIKTHKLEEPTRVYIDYGSEEKEEHPFPWEKMFLTAKQLSSAGAYVEARIVPGARHSEEYWEKRIPVFFDYLLGK